MLTLRKPEQTKPEETCGGRADTVIVIGLYLTEREPAQSLVEWSREYARLSSVFSPDEITVLEEGAYALGRQTTYHEHAVSPLTKYEYVNVPWGRTVWFVWTNAGDEEDRAVFRRVAASLELTSRTPQTLTEAYGPSFVPVPLSAAGSEALSETSSDVGIRVTSSYITPVSVGADIKCGDANAPICNGTHRNAAAYAIDISVSSGTLVRNTIEAVCTWYGWDGSGYGNLIHMYDHNNTWYNYYAHLQSFASNLYTGWPPIPKGQEIGKSGSSGTSAPHLHYHVQNTSGGAVTLSGMQGLSLYSGYPNCGYSSCPGSFEFVCGRVN